jgi:hypothetical protein
MPMLSQPLETADLLSPSASWQCATWQTTCTLLPGAKNETTRQENAEEGVHSAHKKRGDKEEHE